MTIRAKDKQKVAAARESTSTHFPNETTKKVEDSSQDLLNHMAPETLIDPEEDEGGSTHFNNLDKTPTEKNRKMNGGKTTAATGEGEKESERDDPRKHKPKVHPGEVKLAKEKAVKAGVEDDAPEAGEDPDGAFPAGDDDSGTEETAAPEAAPASGEGFKAEQDEETGLQDTQHMSNDLNPAEGYITVSDAPGLAETSPAQPKSDSGVEMGIPEGATPQPELVIESEGGGDVDTFEDAVEEPGVTDPTVEEVEVELPQPGAEEMPIMDIDGADDEADDVVFANIGTDVCVIKANRIIATLSQKQATKAGFERDYLSDNFAAATSVQMEKQGVRAGLASMGFKLATVNVAKADVINKRVQAKAEKLTAGLRQEASDRGDAMEQCLAIAAVGINRAGYFKDTRNELRAALESEFTAAGVRGAEKLIRRVFASHGVEYAKAILTIASQLSHKPVEVRNAHASALDMCGEEEGHDEGLSVGEGHQGGFQSQMSASEHDDEFVDEFAEGSRAPETIHAALVRPASYQRREVRAGNGLSVTAAAILSGDMPLPFGL